MQDRYDAIVIGSGLGGLTAGALYAHAGHRVLVLERNDAFGGAATTYHRGAMTIEASLHETADPRLTGDPKGEIFAALDLYRDVEFVPAAEFYEVRCPLIGAPLTIPHGLNAVRDRLTRRFPEEVDAIRRFMRQLGAIHDAMGFFLDKHDGLWWLAHGAELPFRLWPVVRDIRSSLSEVMERYFGNNEAIKLALAANLPYYADDPDRMWWLGYAVAQGGFFHAGGNFLKGGSQVLSDRLVDRIRAAGGEAITGETVGDILLDDTGAVSGVRSQPRAGGDARVFQAPVVFANASPFALESMLPAPARADFMAPYRDMPLSISLFSITLGLDRLPAELGLSAYSTMIIPPWMRRLTDFRDSAALLADRPGAQMPAFGVVDYSRIDSGMAGGGLFPVSVAGVDRVSNWEGLSDADYRARKEAWLDAIVARLDAEWPGFAAAVVQRDMATARTMRDYLNTPGGAVYGFAPDVPARLPLTGPPRTPRTAVAGLWLASAFGGFGGFSGAMGTGGAAAKAALRESR